MIKKQIVEGIIINEKESSLTELRSLLEESLVKGTIVIQLFETAMHENGISMSSLNEINIENSEVTNFMDNLIITINNGKLCMTINKKSNILIQRPEPDKICKVFFRDFDMWLMIR